VGPLGLAGAGIDVVVVGCAVVTTSEVVVLGLGDVALVVVVVDRGTLAEVLALVLGLGFALVLVLSVAAAPVCWLCSAMTASCREIKPTV